MLFHNLPQEFEFEFQGGQFSAKKSFLQNTLDKSNVSYVIFLEGFGEYAEARIPTNADDWVAVAIEAVKIQTTNLAAQRFLDVSDSNLTDTVSAPGVEEPNDELDEGTDDDLPFEPVDTTPIYSDDFPDDTLAPGLVPKD